LGGNQYDINSSCKKIHLGASEQLCLKKRYNLTWGGGQKVQLLVK